MESGIKDEVKPILLISASDSSAAAGMQMDLRVLNDLKAPARCTVTAVTIQGDGGAKSINPVDPDIILQAVTTALSDKPGIGAVKIGLIGDPGTAIALQEPLEVIKALDIPVVMDPVMRSTPGSALSVDGTALAILENILPLATLVTPNREELSTFAGLTGAGGFDELEIAEEMLKTGISAVLVTGGDTKEDVCVDVLYAAGGKTSEFRHPRIGDKAPRGTGCALSSALAVHMSRGMSMEEAVGWSIDYVTGLIEGASMVGDQMLLLPGRESGMGVMGGE